MLEQSPGREGEGDGGRHTVGWAPRLLGTWKRPTRTLSVEATCTRVASLAVLLIVAFSAWRKASSGARDSVTLPTITDMTAKVPAGPAGAGLRGEALPTLEPCP